MAAKDPLTKALNDISKLSNLHQVIVNPVDAWIDAIPEEPYALCPCGCGMKWRFALKDGIEKHETRFMAKFEFEGIIKIK